jgi:predicted nucleic acid-binding protein
VIIVLDACTLINLANGESLSAVLDLPDANFLLSTLVRRESKTVAAALDDILPHPKLTPIDDEELPAKRFLELKDRFKLGDGETECLLTAEIKGCKIACDDYAARKAAERLFGKGSLTGSIGLLSKAVQCSIYTPERAFSCYCLMKERGGFLPNLSASYFEIK